MRAERPLTLVIGNKNYSSWPCGLGAAARAGDSFTERQISSTRSVERHIAGFRPPAWCGAVGRLARQRFCDLDTLAIAERLHDLFPVPVSVPADARARARARSLCAEFHSGFRTFRRAIR